MANEVIKNYAEKKGVKLWQIAAKMGMLDTTFSKKLRFEFDKDTVSKVKAIIDSIAQSKG